MSNEAARRLIEDYAADAAQRSGLAEPQRSDARAELESHLFDAAAALAKPAPPTREHARKAIASLGSPQDVDTAFFAPHRSGAARATWGRRIGAFLIDAMLILIATSIVMAPFQHVWPDGPAANGDYTCRSAEFWGVRFWTHDEYNGTANPCDRHAGERLLHWTVHGAGFLLYFGLLEGSIGRTPGKMALGLRVLSEDGTPPGFGRAFGRSVSKALFPLILLDWLFGLGTKDRRQRISDQAAHTIVVRDP